MDVRMRDKTFSANRTLNPGIESLKKRLTFEEIQHFTNHGYVVIQNVFPRELAEQILLLLWSELGIDPMDKSSWTAPSVTLNKVLVHPPFNEILTERYLSA